VNRIFFWAGAPPAGDGAIYELLRIGVRYYRLHLVIGEWTVLAAAGAVPVKVDQAVIDAIPEFK
jgi:hypothetical protein